MPGQTALGDAVLEFIAAHGSIVKLFDAVVEVPHCTPHGWGQLAGQLETLHRLSHDMATFLVVHGRETPEAARQVVTAILHACETARQQFERNGLAYVDLPAYRDAAALAAEPVYQAMRLYYEELMAQASALERKASGRKQKGPTVNERMAAMLQADPGRVEWPASEWTKQLSDDLHRTVSPAAVKQTDTWKKQIVMARAMMQADQAARSKDAAGKRQGR
jgi:hypothetical protein